MVYNTATMNDVTPGIYINDGTRWLPISTAFVQNATYASATISCSGALSGTYYSSIAMTSANTKVISITANTTGSYTASTNTVNGVTFAASGTLFSSGAGTQITLVASGAPAGGGTFTYTASLGGQTCTFDVTFSASASFNCSGATTIQSPKGSLNAGTYTGSYTLPYTGGNGRNYGSSTQTISGLTLTRTAGTYATGGGNVVYNLTGTYNGVANGSIYFSVPECTTASFAYTSAYFGTPYVYGANNVIWMDRNLGASEVATSSTDAAAYGDLYQWGRGTDGHQSRTSSTTTTQSSSDAPGNALFIIGSDWRTTQNDNLWQGLTGINNPCPDGYRLPSQAEFTAESNTWVSQNATGAYNSALKLPLAGGRSSGNGAIVTVGTFGGYWCSTVASTNSILLGISTTGTPAISYVGYNRASGFSVRCVRN